MLARVHAMEEMLITLFFFFQAEDGIRDDLVTGVQTCALPISARWRRMGSRFGSNFEYDFTGTPCAAIVQGGLVHYPTGRSEERRVGKECRSRGGREREKKNNKYLPTGLRSHKHRGLGNTWRHR